VHVEIRGGLETQEWLVSWVLMDHAETEDLLEIPVLRVLPA